MEHHRELLVEEIMQAQKTVVHTMQATAMSPWLNLDLTMSQLKGLVLLANNGPMMVSHLAEALAIGKPAASILVDRLVQLELVERAEDPLDRRRALVRLSSRGEDLVVRLRQGGRERMRAWISRLDDGDLAALWRGLRALAAIAEADQPASVASLSHVQ